MTISEKNQDEPSYKKEFEQSVILFEKSFKGVQTSTFEEQKHQYVKALEGSLRVMQDAACGMVNEKLVELRNQLQTHLNEFLEEPSESTKEKVENDIKLIKREEE